jgi:hypothetical protein
VYAPAATMALSPIDGGAAQVHYLVAKQDERSRSGPFPPPLRQDRELQAAILRTATGLFGAAGVPLPCVRLALGATGFHSHTAGGQDIARLFARAATSTAGAGPATGFPSAEAFRAPLPALPKVIEDGKTASERRATVLHYFARAEPSHHKRRRSDDDDARGAHNDGTQDDMDDRCARCGRAVPAVCVAPLWLSSR